MVVVGRDGNDDIDRRRLLVAIGLMVVGGVAIVAGLTVLPWAYETSFPGDPGSPVDRDLAFDRVDYVRSDGGPPRPGLGWYLQRGAFIVAAAAGVAAAVALTRRAARAMGWLVLGLALVHYGFIIYWVTQSRSAAGPWVMLAGYLMVAGACFVLAPSRLGGDPLSAPPISDPRRRLVAALVLGTLTVGAVVATIVVGTSETIGRWVHGTDRVSCGSVFDMPAELDSFSCVGELRNRIIVTAALLGVAAGLAVATTLVALGRRVRWGAVVGVGVGAALLAGATWGVLAWAVT